MKQPSAENIFFFDAGRSYHAGMMTAIFNKGKFSLKEFKIICRYILIRYLKDENVIAELYQAYLDGYEKGSTVMEEMRSMWVSEPKEMV